MSDRIEWVDHTAYASVQTDVADAFGSTLDPGCLGLCFGNVVVEGTLEQLRTFARRISDALDEADEDVDTSSSASRQHYIDTGRYLPVGHASRFGLIGSNDTDHDDRGNPL